MQPERNIYTYCINTIDYLVIHEKKEGENHLEGMELKNIGMNTLMLHKAFGRYAEEALQAIHKEAARLEEQLSCFLPDSEISTINSTAGKSCPMISRETYDLLARAVDYSRYSSGLFDVTVGPLVRVWRSCRDTLRPPDASLIKEAMSLVNYQEISFKPKDMSAGLMRNGQSIDLGGIGKGYAGDKFIEVFRSFDIDSAYTNIGGNVVTVGSKPDGTPWKIGIQHPRSENSLIGMVSVIDKAVVTSGDYQRYFIGKDGIRYHHIIDPTTGYPAKAGLLSTTIISDNSMRADALSTILFIAGMDQGLTILEQFPGTEAIFIDHELKVYITAGLAEDFKASPEVEVYVLK